VMGSPNAIAPEVIRNATNVSPQADLYAVGTLLFELLTGKPPFGADSANAVFMRQVATTPPPLPATFPPALVALVAQLIDPEPSRRPESALAVRERLLSLRQVGPAAPVASTASSQTTVLDAPPPRDPSRRAPFVVAAVLVVGGAGAGMLVFGGSSEGASTPPRPPVETRLPPPLPPVVDLAPVVEDAGVEVPIDAGAVVTPTKRGPVRTKKKSDYEE